MDLHRDKMSHSILILIIDHLFVLISLDNLKAFNDFLKNYFIYIESMSSATINRTAQRRKYFIVLNETGGCLGKVPFQTTLEKFQYERRVQVESQQQLIIQQQKIQEQSTYELQFEPFIPSFNPVQE